MKEFDPEPRRHVQVDPAFRSAILEGLHEAAQSGGGTSYSSFCGFPIQVAGKTGTAERLGHAIPVLVHRPRSVPQPAVSSPR